LRQFIRENIHRMDLPGTIQMMANHYLSAPNTNCRSLKDINLGCCMDFADDIIEKCGGETADLYRLDTMFFYESNGDDEDHQFADTITTTDGAVWNKEALDQYGYPPDVENAHIGIHQWIFNKGKHYDAEAPNGVDTPWELPFFKRDLAGVSHLREDEEFEEDEEEDEEEDFSHLKNETHLKSLFPLLVAAAQKEYDQWRQDEDGIDEVLGSGGICQDIASEMASVMNSHGIDCSTVSQSQGEQHVYCICKLQEGVYEVDISPYVYETGGGYNWRKIPNVKFDESHLSVSLLSHDPNEFEAFTEEW